MGGINIRLAFFSRFIFVSYMYYNDRYIYTVILLLYGNVVGFVYPIADVN